MLCPVIVRFISCHSLFLCNLKIMHFRIGLKCTACDSGPSVSCIPAENGGKITCRVTLWPSLSTTMRSGRRGWLPLFSRKLKWVRQKIFLLKRENFKEWTIYKFCFGSALVLCIFRSNIELFIYVEMNLNVLCSWPNIRKICTYRHSLYVLSQKFYITSTRFFLGNRFCSNIKKFDSQEKPTGR